MNKDVVYIEPEDDITDIIARVKSAKQKVVALVPPKKIGVLRSAVNTKLIAKAAKSAGKVAVIVTTDSSLIKLAAAAQLPVAKTLQSRPKLPSEIIKEDKERGEQVIDENDFDDDESEKLATGVAVGVAAGAVAGAAGTAVSNGSKSANKAAGPAETSRPQARSAKAADQSFSSDDIEKDEKNAKDDKNSKQSAKNGAKIPALEKYRKWIIAGGVALVALIVFLVWAFGFAPAANIAVAIRTTTNNFSENVSFTTKQGTDAPSEGKFYLEQQKVEKTSTVEFTATGQKDIGKKASGTLNLTATFSMATAEDTISVPAGSTFARGEYKYITNQSVNFRLDGTEDDCTTKQLKSGECTISSTVSVTAADSGDKYNIGAYDSASWVSPVSGVTASNSAPFTGGTSEIVTVVSESDVNSAKEKLNSEGREDGRAELLKLFGDDMTVIESSLEVNNSDPVATPGVGEEVKSGVKPKIESKTTYTMFAVDKTKLEDYVRTKSEASLSSDQRIYAVDTPFFENFTKSSDGGYTAKLKSSTQTGPKVSEEDILEKSRGRKVGEVQSLLKSINGVSSVKITTSFPWVSSVPDDPNKITIELKEEE